MARPSTISRMLLLGLMAIILAVFLPPSATYQFTTESHEIDLSKLTLVEEVHSFGGITDDDLIEKNHTKRAYGTLVPGAADNEAWCAAVAKGEKLLGYMTNGDAPAPATTDYAALASSGWIVKTPGMGLNPVSLFPISQALSALGLSAGTLEAPRYHSKVLQSNVYPYPDGHNQVSL